MGLHFTSCVGGQSEMSGARCGWSLPELRPCKMCCRFGCGRQAQMSMLAGAPVKNSFLRNYELMRRDTDSFPKGPFPGFRFPGDF